MGGFVFFFFFFVMVDCKSRAAELHAVFILFVLTSLVVSPLS